MNVHLLRELDRLSIEARRLLGEALVESADYTRSYTPQTNGKAERFIQTCLREWAYGRLWHTSAERTSWLPAFLDYDNNRRAHSALGYSPSASRLGGNNLLTINIWRPIAGGSQPLPQAALCR